MTNPKMVTHEKLVVTDPGLMNIVAQAHLNEYQALTMRNTYWITLQFACWPILLLYVALVAQVWNVLNKSLLIWGSGVIVQVVILTWYQCGHEMYNNVVYMESQL